MGLETATTISGLDASWPLSGDPTNRGDDHFRLIKDVLQLAFPGELGGGFNTAILATEAELNHSVGLTSNIQTQFNALGLRVDALEATLSAPSGTVMSFFQAAAPTGWTQVTSINDAMMRIVSTAGGGSFTAGDSPILMNKVPSHTHTTAVDGAHTHTYTRYNTRSNRASATGPLLHWEDSATVNTGSTTHSHSVLANAGADNWTPNYTNHIIASKDA